jgi:hypothetical protein
MPSYTEEDVTNAIYALVNSEYKSVRKAAIAFQIPSSTLHDRRKKSKSRTQSHVSQQLSSSSDENELSPISDRWVDRFRTRHPRIKSCFPRTIDAARSTALDFSTIKSYFDNLGEVLREHKYPPSAIYNVDKTGFSIGSSRKSVVLLDQLNQRREKKQPGR